MTIAFIPSGVMTKEILLGVGLISDIKEGTHN